MIRHKIIDAFRGGGAEPSLDEVAGRLGLDGAALVTLLQNESPLDDLAGLTLDEAKRVIGRFKDMAIFTHDLEKAVLEFDQTRGQIHEIEKLSKGGGSVSGK